MKPPLRRTHAKDSPDRVLVVDAAGRTVADFGSFDFDRSENERHAQSFVDAANIEHDLSTRALTREQLTLKWGTLKGWDLHEDGPAHAALKRYHESGPVALGARDTPEQKQAILDLIDALDADQVYLSWDGRHVSKEEAKEYVASYGKGR